MLIQEEIERLGAVEGWMGKGQLPIQPDFDARRLEVVSKGPDRQDTAAAQRI